MIIFCCFSLPTDLIVFCRFVDTSHVANSACYCRDNVRSCCRICTTHRTSINYHIMCSFDCRDVACKTEFNYRMQIVRCHFVCTISSKISGSATFACLSWSFTPKYLDADVVPPQTRLTCYELSPHQVYTHRNLDTSVLKRDDSSALTLHLRGLMISSELGTDTSVG